MHGETHEEKPLIVRVVMILLLSLLASAALLSNGFVLAVIGRFKSLRTVPNILLANLAVVDLLSAAINVPIYMISYVWEASWFRGKILAIISSSLNRLFLMLNLVSMLAMMINMYLAISFGLRYLAWKTKKKALICVIFIWFACIVMATLFALPLFNIDLDNAHVSEYRAEIFEQAKYFVAAGTSILIICSALVSFLTACAIRRKRMKRKEMNLSSSQAEVRLREDVKATKTIAITIAAYFFCFIPAIVFAAVVYEEDDNDVWFSFIARYSIDFSSTVNPIIYYTRTRRCRSAFKQLIKNPFGSSDYKERPNFNNTRVLVGNRDGVEQENSRDVKLDGNPTGETYASKRRNALATLSIESVRVHEAGYYADGKQLSWEGQMSKCGVEAFDQLSGEETKGGHDKLNETKRQKIREQLRQFSKVHSLEVVATDIAADDSAGAKRIESAHHFRREEKRQEFSGKRKGTVSNSLVLLKVRKAAWQATEEEDIGQTMSKPN